VAGLEHFSQLITLRWLANLEDDLAKRPQLESIIESASSLGLLFQKVFCQN
jgi:hypothetical protein